jgi:hypothetical protein
MQCILYKIYFWKVSFHMYYKLISILYALLCGQNFIFVKSGCYRSSAWGRASYEISLWPPFHIPNRRWNLFSPSPFPPQPRASSRSRSLLVSQWLSHPIFDSFCSGYHRELTILWPLSFQLKLISAGLYRRSRHRRPPFTGERPLSCFSSPATCLNGHLMSTTCSCS